MYNGTNGHLFFIAVSFIFALIIVIDRPLPSPSFSRNGRRSIKDAKSKQP
jgi:hypothetical protein